MPDLNLTFAICRAEIPDLALIAERPHRSTDLAAMSHEIDMQRVPEIRWHEPGKLGLELLVIESEEREPEFAVRPQAGKGAANVGIHGEHFPPERVHHDAVRALPADLGERAEKF